jgi:hypothetical protein
MSVLFAHHLEPQHFPVLLAIFAAGFFIGWKLVGGRGKSAGKSSTTAD